ncbi:host attachment protein [Marivita hallyeonensis]|uniref:Protein required for attachment to host cells n=1 Tax=Marivita hallyeonensis TaxID=996342 RepID=A0A1M5VS40_9RHOB|nr:host attachment family protein [Marivita hallyeonensis]SHH78010.1 Protein required for attachment to host cells [Marivita hallyeonensis]
MTKRLPGLPAGAWVLIADGEKALFLVNRGDEQDMNLDVLRKDEQDNPKAQDWAENRPGRFNDGPGVQRSAVDDTDWHELEKERFAKELSDRLYGYAHKGAFDALAIVASRVVLSELRNEMHKEVADRVILDVPKVLTNHPIEDIEAALSDALTDA